nr:LON peptidase substrate-binding domain-containing protein [Cerasicoccus arenae]
MTLANTVFFPHAMLPLHIFEPRYRQMLEDVLAGDRLFVVAREDEARGEATGEFEPPCQVASVGVVRACQREASGSSHLILQGLARVRFTGIVHEDPYRLGEFEPLDSAGADAVSLAEMRHQLARTVRRRQQLGAAEPEEVFDFLDALTDPETYLDLTSFTLCEDNDIKQQLLETLNTQQRFRRLVDYLERDNEKLSLEHQLRGKLDEDDIDRN